MFGVVLAYSLLLFFFVIFSVVVQFWAFGDVVLALCVTESEVGRVNWRNFDRITWKKLFLLLEDFRVWQESNFFIRRFSSSAGSKFSCHLYRVWRDRHVIVADFSYSAERDWLDKLAKDISVLKCPLIGTYAVFLKL